MVTIYCIGILIMTGIAFGVLGSDWWEEEVTGSNIIAVCCIGLLWPLSLVAYVVALVLNKAKKQHDAPR
jgi:hypothetical protein